MLKHRWHNVAQALPGDDGIAYGGAANVGIDDSYGYPIKGGGISYNKLPGDWYYSGNYVCSPTFGCVPIPSDVSSLPVASASDLIKPVPVQPIPILNAPVSNDVVAYSSSNVVETSTPATINVPVLDESGRKVGIIVPTGEYVPVRDVPVGTELVAISNGEEIPITVDAQSGKALDTSGNIVNETTPGPNEFNKLPGTTTQAGIGGSISELAKSLGIDANTKMTPEKTTILLATGIAILGILALMFKK